MNDNRITDSPITEVSSIVTDIHKDTHRKFFDYYFRFADDTRLLLTPVSWRIVNTVPDSLDADIDVQYIENGTSLVGDAVSGVLTNKVDDKWTLVALTLVSGRVASNVYRCGGGTILHVESVDGFRRHMPGDWNRVEN